MTRADVEALIDAWARLLRQLNEMELRSAVAESRLPADAEATQLRHDIGARRQFVIQTMVQLHMAANALTPPTMVH